MSGSAPVVSLLFPVSRKPRQAQSVRVFLNDGTVKDAVSIRISDAYHTYVDYVHNHRAIDINSIKGWQPSAVPDGDSAE